MLFKVPYPPHSILICNHDFLPRGALTTPENGRRDAHSEALLETPDNQLPTEKVLSAGGWGWG